MAVGGAAPPRGSAAAAAANLRRRRTAGGGTAAGGAAGNMLQFYTDDAPGLKISPNVVLVMSIGFIAFVAILHVMGEKKKDYALVLAIPGKVISYNLKCNKLDVLRVQAFASLMASNLPLKTLLLVVCLSVLLPQPSVSTPSTQGTITNHHNQVHGLEIGKISAALSAKGYIAMSIILQGTLSSLPLPFENTLNTTTFTIFCPPDNAFFTPKYPQPPVTLIQYHIVPSNLDRESLESSPRGRASINDVKVTEWDMYNDGRLIVHGVEDFFDPAFQTLLYPWNDSNNRSNKNGIDKSGVGEAVSSSLGSATSSEKDMTVDNLFITLAVVSLAGSVLSLVCLYRANRRYSGYSFISTEVY
ncbi:hypothetical protein RHSIM_Rhsim01G0020900 [Rhododendron simsii]|uniref:FAS1 domain-containing protein n=1 Tax=Rhododendron simsii TaxID=118357 RepID=A0A834LZC7_RHOSS|nr:hypothetical protein RHSIM_Rhsim01G0020900 [Rhododendron simsii]